MSVYSSCPQGWHTEFLIVRVFNDEILIATTQTYNTKAGKQFVVRVFTVVYKTPEVRHSAHLGANYYWPRSDFDSKPRYPVSISMPTFTMSSNTWRLTTDITVWTKFVPLARNMLSFERGSSSIQNLYVNVTVVFHQPWAVLLVRCETSKLLVCGTICKQANLLIQCHAILTVSVHCNTFNSLWKVLSLSLIKGIASKSSQRPERWHVNLSAGVWTTTLSDLSYQHRGKWHLRRVFCEDELLSGVYTCNR